MRRTIVNRFSNSTIEDRADMAIDLFNSYSLNGMIMFMNRSCKAVSFAVPTLKEILTRRTGIPALVFESDMGDPSVLFRDPRSARASRPTSKRWDGLSAIA